MAEDHPIKRYRDREKLTQEGLAAKIGVSSITVSRWETGARKVDGALLARVSGITGIPRADLRPDLAALFEEAAQ